ncbi:hypothetical protein [Cellulomonas rhizosphaerae]|uniref:Uncharacterized protein n=1 Tax=Cellulomonas rhizosphaerae TaxID=2293719 RepID=A0A413RNU2_9CELL|nr:hypothetical protein [Cellulomonas rhizosphaerae]RHA43605.1 hypothetical protein D1825_05460 [Cellulomonas rhizosphaerae]
MEHKPAAPALAWAIALVGGGLLMTLFFFSDEGKGGGIIGLVALFAGIVCALVGLFRLAMNVDFLTEREIARADGEQSASDETHEERMARIHAAARQPEE